MLHTSRMGNEKKKVDETEKGFGTGLRAQLERRRDTVPVEAPAAPSEGQLAAAHALAETPTNGDGDDARLEAVRAELAASLAREQDLRKALSDQLEAREHELDLDRDFATRATELDGRAAKLAAAQTDLEERERRLASKLEAVKEDERRMSDLRARLDR